MTYNRSEVKSFPRFPGDFKQNETGFIIIHLLRTLGLCATPFKTVETI